MTRLYYPHRGLDLSVPRVMGILNVTPDSFSDGGRYSAHEAALAQARAMVEAGADIIDVGGESTRPGAEAVTLEQELARTIPIIEAIAATLPVAVSIDTSKPEVMRQAVAAGASMINDVMALRQPGALTTVAALGVPVCLMHMQGQPRTMQQAPSYQDVTAEVMAFLRTRVEACLGAGMAKDHLIIDPGFGFGKTLTHNLHMFHELERFHELGLPVLVGVSRKSMVGAVLDKPVGERMVGSVALATLAAWMGASIVRVHDVEETVDALKMCMAVKKS